MGIPHQTTQKTIEKQKGEKMSKLPKNPVKGQKATIIVNNKRTGKRRVTFQCTGKKGFGKWKILKNEKA